MRLRALLLVCCLLPAGLAAAGSFAGLVITAAGDEEYDIATGITTLSEGGTVVHRERGIELMADFISYRAGEYVETGAAELQTEAGTVTAGRVRLELEKDRLEAAGGIRFSGSGLGVSADGLTFSADSGIVELRGSVTSLEPAFSAERLLFDPESGTALLFGPYTYDDGLLELSAEGNDSLLELTSAEGPSGAAIFSASSGPSSGTLELFAAWLD